MPTYEGDSDLFAHTHDYEVAPNTQEEMDAFFDALNAKTFSHALIAMISQFGEYETRDWLTTRNSR